MPARLDPATQARITRLLFLRQPIASIASSTSVSLAVVYRIQANLIRYGTPSRPRLRTLGCPRKITKDAEQKVMEYLQDHPSAGQRELTRFLKEELRVEVSTATMSRFLKRERTEGTVRVAGAEDTALAREQRQEQGQEEAEAGQPNQQVDQLQLQSDRALEVEQRPNALHEQQYPPRSQAESRALPQSEPSTTLPIPVQKRAPPKTPRKRQQPRQSATHPQTPGSLTTEGPANTIYSAHTLYPDPPTRQHQAVVT